MDAEKLTEALKIRPILYETNTKSYKDTAKKEEAWKDVAEELGCSGKLHIININFRACSSSVDARGRV